MQSGDPHRISAPTQGATGCYLPVGLISGPEGPFSCVLVTMATAGPECSGLIGKLDISIPWAIIVTSKLLGAIQGPTFYYLHSRILVI